MINWQDEKCKVTEHFTIKDCLWLNSWRRLANESELTDDIKVSLLTLCVRLENVRQLIGGPMNVHSMFRPPRYSQLVGGSPTDVHVQGWACDFDSNETMSCDEIKQLLRPKLEELDIRMEDNGADADWVHIDIFELKPGHQRFFKP